MESGQGRLLHSLQEHLDSCYLLVLREVLIQGNPSCLKIGRASVNLSLGNYVPEDSESALGSWFTLNGVVSDAWKAYHFLPFSEKYALLCKSIDFSRDESQFLEMRKHVLLRNCVQHNRGKLKPDTASSLGVEKVTIRSGDGTTVLSPWREIIFTHEELIAFGEILTGFADQLEAQMKMRFRSPAYSKTSDSVWQDPEIEADNTAGSEQSSQ